MRLPFTAADVPGRVAAGAFVLHTGLEKWKGSKEQAAGVHRMAAAAYPVLEDIPPEKFLKLLAAGEVATGAILLAPFVPSLAAGAALTGFSGALLGMYARTPALRKPGSIWPSPGGIAVSKDIWMLGIGLGLIVGALTRRASD